MKHLSVLHKYFWKYKQRLVLGVLFIILSNYFRILSPQLTGYVLNTVVHELSKTPAHTGISAQQNNFLVQQIINFIEQKSFAQKFMLSGIALLLLALISGFFMFLMRQTIIVMIRWIEYDQKNQVFDHYQQLDTGFYKAHTTGDLMNRISEDISRVRMYTGPAIMYFINLAAVLGFSIFFMLKASPKLTLVALSPLPFLAIIIYLVNTLINKKSEKIQALLSDLTTNAQESYSGIRVIKSFVQEKQMLGFFNRNSELYKDNALSLAKTEAIYFPSMALLIGISTLLTIMVGTLDVIHKVPGADVGKIAEFVMYIQMFTFPVSAIGWTASMTQRAAASQKRINEFLDDRPVILDSGENFPVNYAGDIEFSHVDFTYPYSNIQAIRDFSLKISAGQKIAIIGKTGSGKSTLAQLMMRMYDPQQGAITIDNAPLNKVSLHELRSSISYVPQDVFLFSDTIANNIAFGSEGATQASIEASAHKARIHDEIMGFETGYETLVGERGVTLSGGQKQRISIARALIQEKPIVIFDDCLSAVDARTEKEILNNFKEYLSNKTAIIITHRIFTLFEFDQIIVLDDGQIAEKGTHPQLLALNGIYTELYQKQQHEQTSDGDSYMII